MANIKEDQFVYAKRLKDGKVWSGKKSEIAHKLKKKEFELINKDIFDKEISKIKRRGGVADVKDQK